MYEYQYAAPSPSQVRTRSVDSDLTRLRGAPSVDRLAIETRTAYRTDVSEDAPAPMTRSAIAAFFVWPIAFLGVLLFAVHAIASARPSP